MRDFFMAKQIVLIIVSLIIVIVMFGLFKKLFAGPDNTQLATVLKQGAYLVDVRSPGEFSAGSVKGAINIPLNLLAQKWQQLKGKQRIVVFCQSGNRSSQAKRILEQQGLASITDGGGWRNVQSVVGAQ
jgi:phage shock protein E